MTAETPEVARVDVAVEETDLGLAVVVRAHTSTDGPCFRLVTIDPDKVVRLATELVVAANELVDIRAIRDPACAHCHDDPPQGHTCPECGRRSA
jgi:hypothetical protein